jgi:DNA replication protein DnaC
MNPSEKSKTSSSQDPANNSLDAAVCPICNGSGYLREDLPVGHPKFGKVVPCDCQHKIIADQVRGRLYSLSNLDELAHLTFESFNPRGQKGLGNLQANSIEIAYNQSKMYASSLTGWLFLNGSYGCGKTHLAAAIANFAVQMGIPTLFLTVPDLLDSLRFAYDSSDTTFEQRFNQMKTVELLVLDDFGTQNSTSWAQEKLFQIVNFRYINKLPMVITSNLVMEEIEARIRSRLQDPSIVSLVKILAPDHRRPTDEMGHSEISSLDVLSKRTFANFTDRTDEKLTREQQRSVADAVKEATDYAKNPTGWMIITGEYGSGKTHLAGAIANFRAQLGAPPLVVLVPDLLDHLRSTFSPNSSISYDRLFDEVKIAPLLILDDLGSQSTTPWAKEKLFQLLNYRYNLELPTVITIATDTLQMIDERIATRLRDDRLCNMVVLQVPAYAGALPRANRTRKKA